MRLIALALIGVTATSATAFGQTVPFTHWPPRPGSRIRLEANTLGMTQTGSVVSAGVDSVVFVPSNADMRVALKTSDISRMDVSDGTHRNIGTGALIGFLVAGGTAAIVTAASWQPNNDFDFGRGGDAAIVGGFFGLIGGVVGALIGSVPTESWVRVSIPRL